MLRSCYSTDIRFYRDSDITNRVTWYFTDRTDWLPYTLFASGNWARERIIWPGQGEVLGAPRPWSNGANPGNVDMGSPGCGSADQWGGLIDYADSQTSACPCNEGHGQVQGGVESLRLVSDFRSLGQGGQASGGSEFHQVIPVPLLAVGGEVQGGFELQHVDQGGEQEGGQEFRVSITTDTGGEQEGGPDVAVLHNDQGGEQEGGIDIRYFDQGGQQEGGPDVAVLHNDQGGEQEGGPEYHGISVICCNLHPIPRTGTLTLSGGTGACTCLNGTYSLTWSDSLGYYFTTLNNPCGTGINNARFEVHCDNGVNCLATQWALKFKCSGLTVSVSQCEASHSCGPGTLSITGNRLTTPDSCGTCNAANCPTWSFSAP